MIFSHVKISYFLRVFKYDFSQWPKTLYNTYVYIINIISFMPESKFSFKCEKVQPQFQINTHDSQNSTVRWRVQVVVLGGRHNKRNKVLNQVFMYNCKIINIPVYRLLL